MTPVQIAAFVTNVREDIEASEVSIDQPDDPAGEWWLDVSAPDSFRASVAWRPGFGFGLFTAHVAYGSRPDEVYKVPSMAALRLHSMHTQWQASRTVAPLWLSELRTIVGGTQATLAMALACNQPSVSRLENRGDVKISTLMNYVEALGGKLEIRAHFAEADVAISLPSHLR